MKKFGLCTLILLLVAGFWILTSQSLPPIQAASLATTPVSPEVQKIEQATLAMIQQRKNQVPGLAIYNWQIVQVEYPGTGDIATVYLGAIDPLTNKPIGTEPAIMIAARENSNSPWKITLPSDADFPQKLAKVPKTLFSQNLPTLDLPPESKGPKAGDQIFRGYLLPWDGGKTRRLSGSISHFLVYYSCTIDTCRYAYDFADGTNFPIRAARGGTVLGARWGCANDDHYCTNYIALEDKSTTPTTTQIYLHLEYNSIPQELRTLGTPVQQGTYLGNVDNTGYSFGSHLHFMVVANRWYNSYWWGNSVDIRFDDVTINDGVPRTCYEAGIPYWVSLYGGDQCMKDDKFVSKNAGGNPPTAIINTPGSGTTISNPTISVSGQGDSIYGIARFQLVANYDGKWRDVGPSSTTNPFSISFDVCSAGIPAGPVSLGVYAWDNRGNQNTQPQSVIPLLNTVSCPPPPPSCNPGPDQVALYAKPDYQGACKLFNAGSFDSTMLSPVGTDAAASIQVGSNAIGIAFDQESFNNDIRRSESFDYSDPNLSDNPIGSNTLSSLIVRSRTTAISPIVQVKPQNEENIALTSEDTFMLVWKKGDGASEYKSELVYPNNSVRTFNWQKSTSWAVGSLPAGSYTWKVYGRNSAVQSASPAQMTFTVNPASTTLPAAVFPFSDNMESGNGNWLASGLWHRDVAAKDGAPSNMAWVFNQNGNYAHGTIGAGSLTTPPLAIPANGATLRFNYYYQTEGPNPYWDQRHLQVSVEGAPFVELMQFSDDAMNTWLSSPAIDLSAYASKTIRLRFFFSIIDPNFNGQKGWMIDDVNISAGAPDTSCAESPRNDTPGSATSIQIGGTATGAICPAGDVDYYAFQASSGQYLIFKAETNTLSSTLAGEFTLLDPDGKSILAQTVNGAGQDPALMGYAVTRTGTYYLKIKSSAHPGAGAATQTYRLTIYEDSKMPLITLVRPTGPWITTPAFNFEVNTVPQGLSPVQKVELYWHSTDWVNGSWILIGSDQTSADGWKIPLDPSKLNGINGSALMVIARTQSQRAGYAILWNVQLDNTPPSSALQSLPSYTNSTAITLQWTGSDTVGVIDHFYIDYQYDGGAWQPLNQNLTGELRTTYVLGQPNHSYAFRIHAVDQAGNSEAVSTQPEVATVISTTCTPDTYDASAPDNTPSNATALLINQPQEHNFCSGDEDWFSFQTVPGTPYLLTASSISGGAAAILELYDATGTKLMDTQSASDLGKTATLRLSSSAGNAMKIRVRPIDPGLWGTDTRYRLQISINHLNFMPFMGK